MVRAKFFARTALALTLSLGVAAGGFSAAEAKDKKPAAPAAPAYKPTEKFVKAYVPAAKALETAVKRPDVLAQRQKVAEAAQRVNSASAKPAKDAALADMNAQITALQGMLAPEKALVDAAVASAGNPDDKLISGQLLVNYGNIAIDKNTQKLGLQMQLDSGKLPAETVPLVHFTLGRLAMDVKDYPTAQREIKLAVDGGYTKDEAEFFLANSYLLDKQLPLGLKLLHDAIVRNGTATPEYWIDNGVVQAFNNKMPAETNLLAADLVTNYPSKQNWDRAIFTITTINKYNGQEKLDLLRLRDRTNSFQDETDYIDYIVYADPKRLPAEVLRIIDQGTAAGVISASTPIDSLGNTVGKLQLQAKGRLAEDNNLLVVQEKDARGPKADAATVVGAADTFLSHAMYPKAEEMYRLALTKTGVDAGRVNLRLGIALLSQGKFAEAIDVFGQVKDNRAPIANLWVVYAKQKMAGK
ncbi:MAG: hypothetical protein WBL74_00830 [Novosphingobium sp.]|uniref:hypothetical protein n=1 Tax=Novosphingobium sp. TaxID=1874826 RepID=UPI003C7B3DB6